MELAISQNNLLYLGDTDNKIVYLKINGFSLKEYNNTVLVFHKNKFQEKKVNQLGDWMKIFFLTNKYVYDWFSKDFVVNWLSIFQDFDENDGLFKTYLYKYPKTELNSIKEYINSLDINDLNIFDDWKFVQIRWGDFHLDLFAKVFSELDNNQFRNAFSFLMWIVLWYWKIDIDHNINNVKINLPLKGSILKIQDLLLEFFQKLFSKNVFLKYDMIQKKIGYDLQISIDDKNFLIFLQKSLFKNTNIWIKKVYEDMELKFKSFVKENWYNIDLDWFDIKYIEK